MPTAKGLLYQCKICGREFHPHYRGQQYCSFGCGRHPLRGRPQSEEHKKKRVVSVRRTLAKTKKKCAECGDKFARASGHQRYCSAGCWNAVRARRRYAREQKRLKVAPSYYAALVEKFGPNCGICGVEPQKSGSGRGKGRHPADHDHETGEIRGLLCHRCNTALGLLGDDPQRLLRAVQYLVKHK